MNIFYEDLTETSNNQLTQLYFSLKLSYYMDILSFTSDFLHTYNTYWMIVYSVTLVCVKIFNGAQYLNVRFFLFRYFIYSTSNIYILWKAEQYVP